MQKSTLEPRSHASATTKKAGMYFNKEYNNINFTSRFNITCSVLYISKNNLHTKKSDSAIAANNSIQTVYDYK
jgi:hypothetical protein